MNSNRAKPDKGAVKVRLDRATETLKGVGGTLDAVSSFTTKIAGLWALLSKAL